MFLCIIYVTITESLQLQVKRLLKVPTMYVASIWNEENGSLPPYYGGQGVSDKILDKWIPFTLILQSFRY